MWKYHPIFQLYKSKSIYLYIYSFVFHIYSFYSTIFHVIKTEFFYDVLKLLVYVMNIFKVSCGFIKCLLANS